MKRQPVRPDVAMTGEISLRGLVLPVGGIKEKTIAAARAGIRRVILPARNRRDLEDIPQSVRARLQFIWVEQVSEALAAAFSEPAQLQEAADGEAGADRLASNEERPPATSGIAARPV